MGLREQKRNKTRRQLLSVAARLFQRNGYGGTHMEAIAREAEVARATLFNYFPSKDAIILALAESFEHQYPARVAALLSEPGATDQKIRHAYAIAAEFFAEHRALNEVIFLELVRIRGQNRSANDTAFLHYQRAFEQIVLRGQHQGDVRVDISAHRIAELLTASLVSGLYFHFNSATEDIEATFAHYAELVLQGINCQRSDYSNQS